MAFSHPMRADNAALNRYFKDYVQVQKDKTTEIREEVLPNLDAILDYVNSRDKHYGKIGVRVGSSTQGLSVNTKGDIDYSVVFKLNPNEGEEHSSNILNWEEGYYDRKPRHYGFEDQTQNHTSSLSDELRIVATPDPLATPQTGYHFIGHFSIFNPYHVGLTEFVFNEDLIPFLVRRKFKRLLQEATNKLKLKDDMKLSRIIHGPALTFEAEVTTSDGEKQPVSIDLAVIIRAKLPFLPDMGWPVTGKPWPPQDKIQSIKEMGINLVAKKPFYWQLSFAELEKELVQEIDKDGGCRKIVHRIMKSVYYTVCKKDPALSSYMLKKEGKRKGEELKPQFHRKTVPVGEHNISEAIGLSSSADEKTYGRRDENVWFLELEKYPYPGSWQQENLSERYYGCLASLLMFVNGSNLPQYFDRRINLLKMDRISDIRNDVDKIRSFRFDTTDQKKRPPSDPLATQPFKKTKIAVSNMSIPQ